MHAGTLEHAREAPLESVGEWADAPQSRPDVTLRRLALLAVDLTIHGVVMSGDSQRVEILGGRNVVQLAGGTRSRNPIVVRRGGGFVGLVGFAGTEQIEGQDTADWLRAFSAARPGDGIDAFCSGLATALTDSWRRSGAASVLEILVGGEVSGDFQFWYVRNSSGLRPDWRHHPPSGAFAAENDLDNNYIPRDKRAGEKKDDVLRRLMYSFRQGVLLPAAPVFDGLSALMSQIYAQSIQGFAPIASLDDLGHFARVRMEFLKRLCTAKYGIYAPSTDTPIGGVVHVIGVAPNGEVREYAMGRQDVKTLYPGRP